MQLCGRNGRDEEEAESVCCSNVNVKVELHVVRCNGDQQYQRKSTSTEQNFEEWSSRNLQIITTRDVVRWNQMVTVLLDD